MEAWISNTAMCDYLYVSRSTLYRMGIKGYFSEGLHWRYKDLLNKREDKYYSMGKSLITNNINEKR